MKRSQLSPHARDVLSICEVHLKSDELGIVAAQCLKEVRLSSVVRSFVDCLTPDQRGDLLEYLQTGAFAGLYWVWQEPLRFLSEQEAIEEDRAADEAAEQLPAPVELAQVVPAQVVPGEQLPGRRPRRKRK